MGAYFYFAKLCVCGIYPFAACTFGCNCRFNGETKIAIIYLMVLVVVLSDISIIAIAALSPLIPVIHQSIVLRE